MEKLKKKKNNLMKELKMNKIIKKALIGVGFFSITCFIMAVWNIAAKGANLENVFACLTWAGSIAAYKCAVECVKKSNDVLEKDIKKIDIDLKRLESNAKVKELVRTYEEKLSDNLKPSVEFDSLAAMNEYLTNIETFQDKEQALLDLIVLVNNNLSKDNYDQVVKAFALCFWHTIVRIEDIEARIRIIESLPLPFREPVISYSENYLLDKYEDFYPNSQYNETEYLLSLTNKMCNKELSRKKKP